MKRIITVLLLSTVLCAAVFAQKESDFKTDGKGTITGFEGWDTVIVIPAQIGGVPITAIGNNAFEKQGITGITIPASIKYIGKYAFYGNKLTSVTLPAGVYVGEQAFYNNQLASLTVGAKANIAKSAFYDNKLTRLTLPAGISIGSDAFKGNKLTNITIGDDCIISDAFDNSSLKTIVLGARITINWNTFNTSVYYDYMLNNRKSGTFDNSVRYTEKKEGNFKFIQTKYGVVITQYTENENRLQIPAKLGGADVKGIGFTEYWTGILGAFEGKSTSRILIPEGIVCIGDRAFLGCGLTDITIPKSVTVIGLGAFAGTGITSITIGNGVTSIGNQAFNSCAELASVNIPSSVSSIGDLVFYECANLTEINVDPSNTAYTAENGVLYNKDKSTLIFCPEGKTGAFTISDSVSSIGNLAFFNCTKLTSVTIPDSVTSIGIGAFYQCKNLSIVTFQGTIPSTEFKSDAFPGGDGLRDEFYAKDTANGTPATYKVTSRSYYGGIVWTKQ